MNPFLAHFGGGQSLFSGIALVLAGMLFELIVEDRKILEWLSRVLIILGAVGIVGSTVPQPWWLLCLWGGVFLTWRLTYNGEWTEGDRWINLCRAGFLVVTFCVLALEIPYVQAPPPLETTPDAVLIIGDSLTAGTYRLDQDHRWPVRLQRAGELKVHTLARPGWRTAQAVDALDRASIPEGVDVIVVLLGGNDVMLKTPVNRYRTALDRLFDLTDQHPATVYAFEIPLPPLAYGYGRVTRTVANRHDVRLIPRHRLMWVLSGSRSTLDGVHLSRKGHRELAQTLIKILQPEASEY